MTNPFDKNDLARMLALPPRPRTLALLAALRFVAVRDLRAAGAETDDLAAVTASGLTFRFALQRRMTDDGTTDVFALTRRGAVELARATGADPGAVPSSTRKTCSRTGMFMDHALAISAFAVSLARALAADGAPARLDRWEGDPERLAASIYLMKGPGAPERQPLVADGFAALSSARGPEGLLVEIDRGTERPGYLGAKYRGYLEWWKSGGPQRRFNVKALRILTVAPDAKRTERLIAACREATAGTAAGLYWFASEDALLDRGPLAPIWSNLRAERASLWPLNRPDES
jgi:hypothetical protein